MTGLVLEWLVLIHAIHILPVIAGLPSVDMPVDILPVSVHLLPVSAINLNMSKCIFIFV